MVQKLQTSALIFDIDGTLWDIRALIARVWSDAMSEYMNRPVRIDVEQLTPLLGKPMPEIFRGLFPGQTEAAYREIAASCEQKQAEAMKTEGGRLYPGVAETLPLLAERYPLYIVSNCQCGYIEDFLRLSGLSSFFRDWLCFGDTGTSKGQTILTLMKKAGLHKNSSPVCENDLNAYPAVYLGDIMGDALACREAGIPFIWASYGFGSVDRSYYTEKIGQFSELPALFSDVRSALPA